MAAAPSPSVVAYSCRRPRSLVPADEWPDLYASLQALKGHVQEYPGCQGFDVFVRVEAGGDVRVHCYTTWDTHEQLEAFLERGYTFERLLADLGGLETPSEPDDGEDLLMAASRAVRPARPLIGYRDVGEDVRHSRRAVSRAWVILAVMVVLYLVWTLIIYFLEPGLR